ncbi:hypothetical protein GCM10025789_08680 [Tessaracoccus lubricantis]|uniref:Uncharacterized protein n=1 Tax=Tessaracoccus lubricantis TaxID=545543 RepID=A0ABP9F5M9_9ACTN
MSEDRYFEEEDNPTSVITDHDEAVHRAETHDADQPPSPEGTEGTEPDDDADADA